MFQFAEIYDKYREKPRTFSVEDFSTFANAATGTEDFSAGNDGFIGRNVKKGSYFLDKAINATGLPDASGYIGKHLFSALGGSPEAGEEAFRSVPRMFVDFAPLLLAGTAAVASAPVSAPLTGLAALGGAANLALAGGLGAANAYEKTDSLGSAATAFVAPAVGSYVGGRAASALARVLNFPDLAKQTVAQKVGSYLASQAGALGALEAVNAGQQYAETGELPSYDKDKILTMLTTQLPFAAWDGARHYSRSRQANKAQVELTQQEATANAEREVIQTDPNLSETQREVELQDLASRHENEQLRIVTEPLRPGGLYEYEGYTGRLRPDGESRYVLETDKELVDIGELSGLKAIEEPAGPPAPRPRRFVASENNKADGDLSFTNLREETITLPTSSKPLSDLFVRGKNGQLKVTVTRNGESQIIQGTEAEILQRVAQRESQRLAEPPVEAQLTRAIKEGSTFEEAAQEVRLTQEARANSEALTDTEALAQLQELTEQQLRWKMLFSAQESLLDRVQTARDQTSQERLSNPEEPIADADVSAELALLARIKQAFKETKQGFSESTKALLAEYPELFNQQQSRDYSEARAVMDNLDTHVPEPIPGHEENLGPYIENVSIGRAPIAADGTIHVSELQTLGAKSGTISAEELSSLRTRVPEAFVDSNRVNVKALIEGVMPEATRRAQTFPEFVRNLSKSVGLPESLIDAVEPRISALAERLNLKHTLFGELLDSNALGLATVSGITRRLWLSGKAILGEATTDAAKAYKKLSLIVSHESGHLLRQLYEQGKLPEEAAKAYEAAVKWSETTEPSEIRATLEAAADIMLPSNWHTPELRALLAETQPAEALATLQAIHDLASQHKAFDAVFATITLPAEGRGFFKTLSDFGRKFTKILRGAMLRLSNKPIADRLKTLEEHFVKIRIGARTAVDQLSRFNALLQFDSYDITHAEKLQQLPSGEVVLPTGETARFATPYSTGDELPNWPRNRFGQAKSVLTKLLEPFDNFVAHIPFLRKAGHAILSAPERARVFLKSLVDPIYLTGRLSAAERAMQELWVNNAPTKDAISELMNWQQIRNDLTAVPTNPAFDFATFDAGFMTRPATVAALASGDITVRRAIGRYETTRRNFEARFRRLNPQQQRAVTEYYSRQGTAARNGQLAHISVMEEVGVLGLAGQIRTILPQLSARAEGLGRDVLAAARMRLAGDPAFAQAALTLLVDIPRINLDNFLNQAERVQAIHEELTRSLTERPNHLGLLSLASHEVTTRLNGVVQDTIPVDAESVKDLVAQLQQTPGLEVSVQEVTRGAKFVISRAQRVMLAALDSQIQTTLTQGLQGHGVPQVLIDQLAQNLSFSAHLQHTADVHAGSRLIGQENIVRNAAEVDLVAQQVQASRLMSNSLTRWQTRSRVAFELLDPTVRNNTNLERYIDRLDEYMAHYEDSDSSYVAGINKVVATMALAGNFANHIVELTTPFTTVISRGADVSGLRASVTEMSRVLRDFAGFYRRNLTQGRPGDYSHWLDANERALLVDAEHSEFLHQASFNENLDTQYNVQISRRLQDANRRPSVVGRTLKAFSDSVMNVYSLLNAHNAQIALIHGYRLLLRGGMSPEQARLEAVRYAESAAGGGSKATRALTPYSPNVRSVSSVAMLLSRYSNLWMFSLGRRLQRGFTHSDAALEGLGYDDPGQARRFARQAALWQVGSQILAAGLLGVPFAGAANKVLEEVTGKDLVAEMYMGLDRLFNEDKKEGGLLVDTLMHGFLNSMLEKAGVPVDLGSRMALQGLMGMSEFSGVDANAMFGPTVNMGREVVAGVEDLSKTGDAFRLMKSLTPTALKKALDLALHGDMTDSNKNRMGLTEGEKWAYGLGFSPSRIRKLKEAERITDYVATKRRMKQNQKEAELVDALHEPGIRGKLKKAAQELGVSQKKLASEVAERAIKLTRPKEFRAGIAKPDSLEGGAVFKAFGLQMPQSMETKKAQDVANIYRLLGLVPKRGLVRDAIRTDAALEQQPFQGISGAASRRSPLSPLSFLQK